MAKSHRFIQAYHEVLGYRKAQTSRHVILYRLIAILVIRSIISRSMVGTFVAKVKTFLAFGSFVIYKMI